jgi:hypothetical protein
MSTVEVALHVRVHGALAAAGAPRAQLAAGRPLARSAWGTLILPASQVKGRLRHACEQVAHALDVPVCSPPSPDTMCPRAAAVPAAPCVICRIFGAPGIPSALRWTNLVPLDTPAAWTDDQLPPAAPTATVQSGSPRHASEPAALKLPSTVRAGIALDRRRLVAQDGTLYWLETSPALPSTGLVFGNDRAIHGALGQRPPGTPAASSSAAPAADDGEWDSNRLVQLLLAGCLLATAFGAGETRGLGWSEVRARARLAGQFVRFDPERLRRGVA